MENEQEKTISQWNLDGSHSQADFAVRHMMISTVKGTFEKISGTLTGDPADLENAKVDIRIDTGSVSTRDQQRDGHLKSQDFFYVEKFPEMKFVSKKIKKKGKEDFEITGDLTIRDVTKEVTLSGTLEGPVKDPYGFERFGVSAEGSIDRSQWGLKWNSVLETGGVMVGDKVKISVNIEAVRKKQ
jgi:polyisoprenoid-binding protein YceI